MQSITVIGRRWFDKRYGNTYFSATILVDGEQVHRIECEYGYGDHYRQAAFEWLDEHGLTADREAYTWGGREEPWRYCERKGIKLHCDATDVARKRDL